MTTPRITVEFQIVAPPGAEPKLHVCRRVYVDMGTHQQQVAEHIACKTNDELTARNVCHFLEAHDEEFKA